MLVLSGCHGDVGDTCREDDDCNSGLVCDKGGDRSPTKRGTCQSEDSTGDAGLPEADVGPELDATIDVSEDSGMSEDTGTVDTGSDDTGSGDTGSADTGDTDTGDAGTDAADAADATDADVGDSGDADAA